MEPNIAVAEDYLQELAVNHAYVVKVSAVRRGGYSPDHGHAFHSHCVFFNKEKAEAMVEEINEFEVNEQTMDWQKEKEKKYGHLIPGIYQHIWYNAGQAISGISASMVTPYGPARMIYG